MAEILRQHIILSIRIRHIHILLLILMLIWFYEYITPKNLTWRERDQYTSLPNMTSAKRP